MEDLQHDSIKRCMCDWRSVLEHILQYGLCLGLFYVLATMCLGIHCPTCPFLFLFLFLFLFQRMIDFLHLAISHAVSAEWGSISQHAATNQHADSEMKLAWPAVPDISNMLLSPLLCILCKVY